MAQWFWIVVVYSFFGYCLEKGFARAVNAPHQTRKCFLLLPLCPVYGLAMAAVSALTEPGMGFLPLAAVGGAVCTGVEYLVPSSMTGRSTPGFGTTGIWGAMWRAGSAPSLP